MLTREQFDELEYLFVTLHFFPQSSDDDFESAFERNSIINRISEILKEIINENKNN